MLERPPLPQGTEREQLAALRDYLVRLAQTLERAGNAESVPAAPAAASAAHTAETARREVGELRSLVVKTAGRIGTVTVPRPLKCSVPPGTQSPSES